jgi:hypothetical protein
MVSDQFAEKLLNDAGSPGCLEYQAGRKQRWMKMLSGKDSKQFNRVESIIPVLSRKNRNIYPRF